MRSGFPLAILLMAATTSCLPEWTPPRPTADQSDDGDTFHVEAIQEYDTHDSDDIPESRDIHDSRDAHLTGDFSDRREISEIGDASDAGDISDMSDLPNLDGESRDGDLDLIPTCRDNCPNDADTDQADENGDGIGDVYPPTEEQICNDAIDNDGDGATDCSDPDCDAQACDDGDSCSSGDICQNLICQGTVDCTDSDCNGSPCDVAAGEGWQGACAAGGCIRFAHPLPDMGTWEPVPSPQVMSPEGCGTPELPCNPSGPVFRWMPDTGQTLCYNDTQSMACPGTAGGEPCGSTAFCGHDGQYGWDVSNSGWDNNRFVVSGSAPEEIVTDTWTGLVWTKEYATGRTWADALDYCDALDYGGRDDWRLPDVFELQSLLNMGQDEPRSDFPGMPADKFWSSSTVNSFDDNAFYVGYDREYLYFSGKATELTARCIASEPQDEVSPQRFYFRQPVADQAVVFDTRTGLLWQRSFTDYLTWQEALAHCENLNYGGRTDWRLPDGFELSSLVDLTKSWSINDLVFPDMTSSSFWASTTDIGSPGYAWRIDFGGGYTGYRDKSYQNAVRCVALGPPSPRS